MNSKTEKGTFAFILFFLFIVGLAVGGFYLINKKEEPVAKKEEEKVPASVKKDETLDYVYYTNEEDLSNAAELRYKDININLTGTDAQELETKLNDAMSTIHNKYTKISDQDLDEDVELLYHDDDIYEAQMIDYKVVENEYYFTIVVNTYLYTATDGAKDANLDFYTFDKKTAKLITNEDIMNRESLTSQTIRNLIYKDIESIPNIDIDVTMNTKYTLSYDETKKVVINYIVKTEDLSYNESITIN